MEFPHFHKPDKEAFSLILFFWEEVFPGIFPSLLWVPPVMGQAGCYGESQRPGLLECRGYFFSSLWLHLRFFFSVKSNNINNVEVGGKEAESTFIIVFLQFSFYLQSRL